MKVRQVKIPHNLAYNVPEGATVVRPEASVCEYCKYFAGVCPTYTDKQKHTVPTCNAFGLNTFFVTDTVEFNEGGLCDLIVSNNTDVSKPYTVNTREVYKPNPTDLCTQLLTHAALSSAYFSDKSARELLDAARMFFGADIVETARKLVISYNAHPDDKQIDTK